MGMVADGEEHPQAGASAEAAIESVFEYVKSQDGNDWNATLRDAMEDADRVVREVGGSVAATVVVLWEDKLFFAQVGHTMALLVRGREPIPLTQAGPDRLGRDAPNIQRGSPQGLQLDRDDMLILASDGLSRISPEDGKAYVSEGRIASQVEGNTPREVARHLVSIAMGRDVDDNVSVVAVRIGSDQKPIKRGWVLGVLGILLAVSLLIPGQLAEKPARTPKDYGYGVLIEGALLVETGENEPIGLGRLDTIPPLSVLIAEEPSRLGLQSRNETTTGLALTSLYLDAGSEMRLLHVDTISSAEQYLSGRTVFQLEAGRLLAIRGGGGRELVVEAAGGSAWILGAGPSAMGIRLEPPNLIVDCLQGLCGLDTVDGERRELTAGQRGRLSPSGMDVEGLPKREAADTWNGLCGDCLTPVP
jgi:hypothetical protein